MQKCSKMRFTATSPKLSRKLQEPFKIFKAHYARSKNTIYSRQTRGAHTRMLSNLPVQS